MNFFLGLCRLMRGIAAIALAFMLSITVIDVFLRAVWKPIVGVYEIVSLTGAIVIGFVIPLTSWEKGHVYMDFVYDRFSDKVKCILNVSTRILVILFFIFLGIALLVVGEELRSSGELLLTLTIPLYPFTYLMSLICFIHCIILFFDIKRILGGNK
jgi:TRAP-type C4-dicarboxylate transport system permease small subunit